MSSWPTSHVYLISLHQDPTERARGEIYKFNFAPLRVGVFAVNIELALLAMVANTLLSREGAKTQRRKGATEE